MVRALRHSIPLAPVQKRELFAKFGTVIRATVKGSLVVAAIQGLLGGIAFWVLGVKWSRRTAATPQDRSGLTGSDSPVRTRQAKPQESERHGA